jgi:uncharacterized protein (DUF433 family)
MALPHSTSFPRIVRDPRIVGGEPTIRGTRIPVRSIVLFQRFEGDLTHISEAFPRLTQEDVDEALDFYRENHDEIDRYIRENDNDPD